LKVTFISLGNYVIGTSANDLATVKLNFISQAKRQSYKEQKSL